MDWKQYEEEITNYFKFQYPDAKITPRTVLPGTFSKIERQIDLLIEEQAADFTFRAVVDAKHYNERIDVKDVEQFIGMLQDIGVDVGVMVAPHGYSQAALNRAYFDESRLELDVLSFADVKCFQGEYAIPYSDDMGVFLDAPMGWVVDSRQEWPWPACLYQRGTGFEEAVKIPEWMYVKFSKKGEKAADLNALLHIQEQYTKRSCPDLQIGFLDSVRRKDGAKTAIRRFHSERLSSPEHTGFVEFEKFIFFCVLYSRVELEQRNLRKLRYILRTVLPMNVVQKSPAKKPIPPPGLFKWEDAKDK